jgi:methylthioribose-1-phosphate isomerase
LSLLTPQVLTFSTHQQVAAAIKDMVVRGAPAIGACGGYGLVVALRNAPVEPIAALKAQFDSAYDVLVNARPTAVNLKWALDILRHKFDAIVSTAASGADVVAAFERAARDLAEEDVKINKRMAEFGNALVPQVFPPPPSCLHAQGGRIMHHCNTGALATVDVGTALGVIFAAHGAGKGESLVFRV